MAVHSGPRRLRLGFHEDARAAVAMPIPMDAPLTSRERFALAVRRRRVQRLQNVLAMVGWACAGALFLFLALAGVMGLH